MASLDERGPGFVGIAGGQARRDAQRNGKNAESYATELTQNARLNHDILLRTAARPLLTFDRQGREALSYTPNGADQLRGSPVASGASVSSAAASACSAISSVAVRAFSSKFLTRRSSSEI